MTGDVPIVVVGGGACLCGDSLEGASSLIRPPFAAVANAVGAAIPQASPVSKHEQRLFPPEDLDSVHSGAYLLQEFGW